MLRNVRPALVFAVSAAVILGFAVPVRAQAQTIEVEGVIVTSADITQMLTALQTALKPNDMTIPIVATVKPPSAMPAYDKKSHYAGSKEVERGVKGADVWINDSLQGYDVQNALIAVVIPAIADGGYAGLAFKKLYDSATQKDAQLPADAPDPYLNRHKLVAEIIKVLGIYQ